MQPFVPERLETERLRLRPFADADWRALHGYFGDAEATRFTWGRALTEGETWRTLCAMIGHWHLRGYGPYAVADRRTDEVMGTVGFWYPNDWPEPEIKWGLARRYWGRGYASEAARAVLAAGHEHLPDTRLISLVHDDNAPSIALARALGATRERSLDYEGEPHGVYRHRTNPAS